MRTPRPGGGRASTSTTSADETSRPPHGLIPGLARHSCREAGGGVSQEERREEAGRRLQPSQMVAHPGRLVMDVQREQKSRETVINLQQTSHMCFSAGAEEHFFTLDR